MIVFADIQWPCNEAHYPTGGGIEAPLDSDISENQVRDSPENV